VDFGLVLRTPAAANAVPAAPAQEHAACYLAAPDIEEDPMIETMEKKTELLPIPFEEMEDWPVRMQEFFDLIARRPFELLDRTPRLFGRELESWLRPDTELIHLVPMKLFETDEALVLRAEVPGFTEKELNVTVEPWRVIITGKKEFKEEKEYKQLKEEKKELTPYLREKFMRQIYRVVKLPLDIKTENVKAILKNGVLELTLPKLEPAKKLHVEVKAA
jgi:HSP20 family protein